MLDKIFIGEPRDVSLTGLKRRSTDTYKNDATITWALKELDGTSIATGSLSYVAASDGDYLGVIPANVTDDLEEGVEYIVEWFGADITDRRLTPVAEYRGRT